MMDFDRWEDVCEDCEHHGEPNGCNRKKGVCKAYSMLEDAVCEIDRLRADRDAQKKRADASETERRALKKVCGALSCLLKGIDGSMIYEKVLPMARGGA